MARNYIALSLDISDEDFEVDLTVEAVGTVTDIPGRLEKIQEERNKALAMEKHASSQVAQLAKELADSDVPLRDVGAILNVSHQRAHQLVSSVR